jgi:hypothetical protein
MKIHTSDSFWSGAFRCFCWGVGIGLVIIAILTLQVNMILTVMGLAMLTPTEVLSCTIVFSIFFGFRSLLKAVGEFLDSTSQ